MEIKIANLTSIHTLVVLVVRFFKLYLYTHYYLVKTLMAFSHVVYFLALARSGAKKDAKKAEELLELVEEKYNETQDPDIKPNVRTYTSGKIFFHEEKAFFDTIYLIIISRIK